MLAMSGRDAVGKARDDGELVGRVDALDVHGGVGLRVAELLGLLQGVSKDDPFSLISVRMKLQVPFRMP